MDDVQDQGQGGDQGNQGADQGNQQTQNQIPPGLPKTQKELDDMMANNRRNQSRRIQELETEARRGRELSQRVSDLLDSGIH